jgi:8-oxo-dGTP pyrophosphatase MutT (NUDIX family)
MSDDRARTPTRDETRETNRHGEQLAKLAKAGSVGTKPVQAATVIPVRDGPTGLEVLMLRKNSKIAFGGMWVFPGGRVDEEDRDPAQPHDELATALRAAIREAREEAGIELARDALHAYSHWTPPPITPRRFLTWFFLAEAPPGDVVIDGGEIHEHEWMAPGHALERRDAGEIELAPPTFVTLFELARQKDVGASVGWVRAREPERFHTRIAVDDKGPTAMWHGDAGWESGDATAPGPRHRLLMHGTGWVYERTA